MIHYIISVDIVTNFTIYEQQNSGMASSFLSYYESVISPQWPSNDSTIYCSPHPLLGFFYFFFIDRYGNNNNNS